MTDEVVAENELPANPQVERLKAVMDRLNDKAKKGEPGEGADDLRKEEWQGTQDGLFLFGLLRFYQETALQCMDIVEAASKVDDRCDTENLYALRSALRRNST